MEKKTVVILGGGFAGATAIKKLAGKLPASFELILIDKNPHQIFYPNLYETATSYLEACISGFEEFRRVFSAAIIPFNDIFPEAEKRKGPKLIQGMVKDISVQDQKIVLGDGKLVPFDFLLVALGAEANFFGIPGLEEKANILKSGRDALNLRNKICEVFARKKPNQMISIVVGGGGFTGCEFSAELAQSLKKLAKSHPHERNKISLTLVEASGDILPGAKPWIRAKTKQILQELGVRLIFEQPVQAVEGSNVVLKSGQKLWADILVWTAGVKGNAIIEKISRARIEGGCKLVVNQYLQVIPHENIFAAGDNIHCIEAKSQKAIPATASGAVGQGNRAGENILRKIRGKKLQSYRFKWPVFVMPVAGKNAFSEVFGIKIKGFSGWAFHQVIFLIYFVKMLPLPKAIKLWWQNIRLFIKND